jgi:hypothetical protein
MSSTPPLKSEYQRDQWCSLTAIRDALAKMPEAELETLRGSLPAYLAFREELAAFHSRYFHEHCRLACYETGLSACCGFESIITLFADQLITCLLSEAADLEALIGVLERPNASGKCVFMDTKGCRWRLPPISCAMFYCDPAKQIVWQDEPEAAALFEELRRREKEFTHPVQPVLFDNLERGFRRMGLQTPHMYYHFSPGLVRIKAKAGILDESLRIR